MRPFYSVVGPDGYIALSMVTQTPEHYPIEPGYRFLLDTPPDPNLGEYIPGKTCPKRIEPIPADATEVPYEIISVFESSFGTNIAPQETYIERM